MRAAAAFAEVQGGGEAWLLALLPAALVKLELRL